MSLRATRSAVMIDTATGTPACDSVNAKKYAGKASMYIPIPSPPKILDIRIQLSAPMTFTTKLAIVKMNVPFMNFSLGLVSVIVSFILKSFNQLSLNCLFRRRSL